MGISITEFRFAMETFGAKPISTNDESCYTVRDVEFSHSGSNFIIKRSNKDYGEILDKAMAEFGEKHPG